MPKFDKNNYSELKDYLKIILSETNINTILDSIVNNDTDTLWNFVVGYKLIAHNLDRLKLDDPELAFFVGEFLGNYHAIEKLHKKFEDKKNYNSKIDEIIANSDKVVDVLSDLYIAPAISLSSINSKYGNDINEDLNLLKKTNIIEVIENEKECYYKLTNESKMYMKENYYFNCEFEEKEEKRNDLLRSKTLHLLREENKKED